MRDSKQILGPPPLGPPASPLLPAGSSSRLYSPPPPPSPPSSPPNKSPHPPCPEERWSSALGEVVKAMLWSSIGHTSCHVCNVRRTAPPRTPTCQTTRHSGTSVGKIRGSWEPQPGAVAQDLPVSRGDFFFGHWLDDLRNQSTEPPALFSNKRHSRKKAFTCLLCSPAVLFAFLSSVCVCVCGGGGWVYVSDTVDVLE